MTTQHTPGRRPWNAGKGNGWTDRRGYRWTYIERNGKRVQVREHRAVMERHLGRPLEPWELVHHVNGDTADNRLDNLALMTWEEHTKLHHDDASRSRYLKDTTALVSQMREEIQRLRSDNSDLLAACKAAVARIEREETLSSCERLVRDLLVPAIAKTEGK